MADMQLFIKLVRIEFKNKVSEQMHKPKLFEDYASAYSKL